MSNVKRRSVSYSASHQSFPSVTAPADPFALRGHASAFSFTNPAFLQETQSQRNHVERQPSPVSTPAPLSAYTKPKGSPEEAYASFTDKMGYFRKMGSFSLSPPTQHQPMWRERSSSLLDIWQSTPRNRTSKLTYICLGFLSLVAGALYCLSKFSVPQLAALNNIIPYNYLPHYVACDPYSSFGALKIDHVNPDGTRWQPFDKSCMPPHFLSQLRNGDTSNMDWLWNQTVLTIGDNIDREHVEQFCQLMGRDAEIVRDVKNWAPAALRRQKAVPTRLTGHDAKDATLPRVCYIPEMDFLLASVFHFGMDEDDVWKSSKTYSGPGLFEDRISSQVQPFVRSLQKLGRPTAPDFVEVSSGAFDLMKWAEEDVKVGRSTTDPVDQDRLNWYRSRMEQTLRTVRKSWPRAKGKMWRSIHFPQDQAAELQYFKEQIGVTKKAKETPAHFATTRVLQLDQVARAVLIPPTATPEARSNRDSSFKSFRFNPWGTLMLGHEAHQADRLHGDPGVPSTVLWADVMLSELHRAVLLTRKQ